MGCAFPKCAREQFGERWQQFRMVFVPLGLFGVPFWYHFGVVWGGLGGFEAQVAGERRLREVLGRYGGSLGAVWGLSWAVLGAH